MPMPPQLAAALGKSQGQSTQGAAPVSKPVHGKGKIPPQFLKNAAKRKLKKGAPPKKGKSPVQALANQENKIEKNTKPGAPKSAKELSLEQRIEQMTGRKPKG